MKNALLAALALLALATLNPQLSTVLAQGTAFTYQGQLNTTSGPANGSYDLVFTLYTNSLGGAVVGGPVTNTATAVTNGLFTTLVDFGPGVFVGGSNWLALAVRTNGSNTFTGLSPRQQVTPTPYALTAVTAASAGSVAAGDISGTIPLAQLPASVVTNGASGVNFSGTFTGNGSGLTSLPANVVTNTETGVTLSGAFTGNGAGLTNLNFNGVGMTNVVDLSVGGTNIIAPLTAPPNVPAVAIGLGGADGEPVSVAVAGRYAYVVNQGFNTLQVFDVSTPSAPVIVGRVATGSMPSSVAVAGRYAYVVNFGANTLQVFDVSTPSAPVSVGSAATGNYPQSVAVAGRYAYVVNQGPNTLQVFDVSRPSAPVSVGLVDAGAGTQPSSVVVAGRYAYVANYGASTMQVFDVSTPSAPVSVGSVATGSVHSYPSSVAVAGRYAYVVNFGANTLLVFDVSTPSAPVSVGSVATGSEPFSVVVAGRYAYVGNWGLNTLQVFDVSMPSAPVIVGSVATGSNPISVAVAGRYAYVVDRGNTLQVFDFSGAYLQHLEAGAMETGTLQTRDTITAGNNLDVRGGLTVSASARISGGLGADYITATNFTGNGAGLTNLNAAQLTGTLPLAQLPGAVVTNGAIGVTVSGTFAGNGSGLTSLPANVVTNTETGVTLSGAFTGNGAGLTNLNATQLIGTISTAGTVADTALSANVALLSGNQTFTGFNSFSGNVGIGNTSPGQLLVVGTGGAYCNGTTWVNGSDRNSKQDFRVISARKVLDKVSVMPITEWQYKVDAAGVNHIGPMAQDFHAAFGLNGGDDTHISTVDEGGVALAAIQGLNEKLEAETKAKDAEIQDLKQRVADLKKMVESLAEKK